MPEARTAGGYIPARHNMTMPKHNFKKGHIRSIRNRCWACDKGGTVNNYRIVNDKKDSVRAVHLNEKCINVAKEKYKVYSAGKMTAATSH